jgi:hypothetical protein
VFFASHGFFCLRTLEFLQAWCVNYSCILPHTKQDPSQPVRLILFANFPKLQRPTNQARQPVARDAAGAGLNVFTGHRGLQQQRPQAAAAAPALLLGPGRAPPPPASRATCTTCCSTRPSARSCPHRTRTPSGPFTTTAASGCAGATRSRPRPPAALCWDGTPTAT